MTTEQFLGDTEAEWDALLRHMRAMQTVALFLEPECSWERVVIMERMMKIVAHEDHPNA